MRWPGVVKPGTRNRQDIVSNLDFRRNILRSRRLPIPAEMQGRVSCPVLQGHTPDDWRKYFYYHYYEWPAVHNVRPHYGVVSDRYKLVNFYGDVDYWELFDLQKDPEEMTSVMTTRPTPPCSVIARGTGPTPTVHGDTEPQVPLKKLRQRENEKRGAAADPPIPVAYGTWNPQPKKAALMLVSTHPDDEGIVFGGLIPYYAAVLKQPMVHVAATSGERLPPGRTRNLIQGSTREKELLNADWAYGLRNPPIFVRLRGGVSKGGDAATTLEGWALSFPKPLPAKVDPDLVARGKRNAAIKLATLIRTYRPEVIVTHEPKGDGAGHPDHKAVVQAVVDAYKLAADPSQDLGGLPVWQTKKLYMHLQDRDPGLPMINKLWHDWSKPYDELGGKTPLEVADAGLAFHKPTEGDVVASFAGKRCSEQYGLYASTVGADTVGADGWVHGGFFEHIPLPDAGPTAQSTVQ